jgi:ABC-2 type transport system ATP-binding protein
MIHAESLTKFYERRCVVRDLSFTIQDREIVGFLGLNGAGKTTTLRMLAGLLMPSSGRIAIDGRELLDEPRTLRWRIGFLPERPPLYDDMSVRGYLDFAARLRGVDDARAPGRVGEVVQLTGLGEVADDAISTLSHGYKQRVGIAQAIVHDPSLVILDEPINGLDPAQIVEMRKLIRSLRERHTVLLSSHILSEISQTCDRLLIIQDGRLVDEGTEGHLLAKHGGDGRSFFVVVKGERRAVEAALLQRELVAGFEVLRADGDDKLVELRVDLARAAPEELAQLIVGGGFGLRRLEPVKSELESMFLKLTGARA